MNGLNGLNGLHEKRKYLSFRAFMLAEREEGSIQNLCIVYNIINIYFDCCKFLLMKGIEYQNVDVTVFLS